MLLPNAQIWTRRSSYSPASGSSIPATHLSGLLVHIMPTPASDFHTLPVAALESNYVITVDSGTDIVTGDVVSQMTLPDGVTPWAGLGTNESMQVVFDRDSTPGPLSHRKIYVKRMTGGGPAS